MTRVRPASAGLTLIELLVVLWILGILTAIAVPQALSGLDELRTRAAARYVSSRFYDARFQAVKRSTHVGLRFQWDGVEYRLGSYVDGNGNGIRSADITRGVDRLLLPESRLSALVADVRFEIGEGIPLIDGGFATDPIRVAGGSLVTFGPDGSASTGSVYIRGARGTQYAVRVFGATGRTRIFRFVPNGQVWQAL